MFRGCCVGKPKGPVRGIPLGGRNGMFCLALEGAGPGCCVQAEGPPVVGCLGGERVRWVLPGGRRCWQTGPLRAGTGFRLRALRRFWKITEKGRTDAKKTVRFLKGKLGLWARFRGTSGDFPGVEREVENGSPEPDGKLMKFIELHRFNGLNNKERSV